MSIYETNCLRIERPWLSLYLPYYFISIVVIVAHHSWCVSLGDCRISADLLTCENIGFSKVELFCKDYTCMLLSALKVVVLSVDTCDCSFKDLVLSIVNCPFPFFWALLRMDFFCVLPFTLMDKSLEILGLGVPLKIESSEKLTAMLRLNLFSYGFSSVCSFCCRELRLLLNMIACLSELND